MSRLERSISQTDFNELQDGLQKGGGRAGDLAVYSLESEYCLTIPQISVETASRILGEDWSNASGEAQTFIRSCRFSPLILSTARAIIIQEGVPSNNLLPEILASPNDIAGRDGQSGHGKNIE